MEFHFVRRFLFFIACVVLFGSHAHFAAAQSSASDKASPIMFGWLGYIEQPDGGRGTLLDVPSYVNLTSIFYLNGMPASDGDASFWKTITSQIDTLHKRKQKVVYCVWLNRTYETHYKGKYATDSDAYKAFAKDLHDQIVANHLDGIDVDYEQGDNTLSSADEDKAALNALAKYFGPSSGEGLLLLIDGIYGDGNDPVFQATHSNYDYVVSQVYNSTTDEVAYRWGTYSKWIKPSQFIVTDDFQSQADTNWRSYKNGCPLIYRYADWAKTNGTGGVGAFIFNEDYKNMPSYEYYNGAHDILTGANSLKIACPSQS